MNSIDFISYHVLDACKRRGVDQEIATRMAAQAVQTYQRNEFDRVDRMIKQTVANAVKEQSIIDKGKKQ